MKTKTILITLIVMLAITAYVFQSCKKDRDNLPPTALFTVSTSSGTINTDFAFDASGCTDNEDNTSDLQVRWDYDGDNTWDTDWDYDKTQNHQYSSSNNYTANLAVRDSEGLIDYYTLNITVFGTFRDPRSGKTYKTVVIGEQEWFAENLNYAPSIIWCYEYVESWCDLYGSLFTWDMAMTACPDGWHLPTDDEWKELEMFLGTDAGKKLKATSGWYNGDYWNNTGGGTDEVGFMAFGGGLYEPRDGYFYYRNEIGLWWSATECNSYEFDSTDAAYMHFIQYWSDDLESLCEYKEYGLSVRCVKD